jgi:hypothetical protein
MVAATAAACGSARRSIQIIAGRSGSPPASHTTIPSSCDPNDSPLTADGPSGTSASSRGMASYRAAVHSRGSCSAQVGWG